jgi:hypothetical protein
VSVTRIALHVLLAMGRCCYAMMGLCCEHEHVCAVSGCTYHTVYICLCTSVTCVMVDHVKYQETLACAFTLQIAETACMPHLLPASVSW